MLCRIYFNDWADTASKDEERTEDMLFAETVLALDLHRLQLEHQRTHAEGKWIDSYLAELRKLGEDELRAANQLRRIALDHGNPPSYLVLIHQHRRRIACLQQEIDLLQQAVQDVETGQKVPDLCIYFKHAIQTGSAVITGAR